MTALHHRPWLPGHCDSFARRIASETADSDTPAITRHIHRLIERNRSIHEQECFNLDPAANVMNPRAEALLASGLGSRPSLGYPGDKYETGLEAIEEIEVIAAELCAELFHARFAEIRLPSGSMGNLYAFMATCRPGDRIIAPPPEIGGHVTHHAAGCAGLYGLKTHPAPVDAGNYTVDLDGLRRLARRIGPSLITIGGSLNLFPHPVREIRSIADEVGARVLFDAAHQCGIIAGGAWPDPLSEGAHLMTMSTYKSLGGPPGGLVVTNDADLAQKLEAIAFPGMTANFDVAKSAALALTMLDWREYGAAYADAMIQVARSFAGALDSEGIPVYGKAQGFTRSHQFAIEAAFCGGGQQASRRLRKAGFLSCGIGLPIGPVEGDMNGLRIGTPELVRRGVTRDDIGQLASLVARGLTADSPESIAAETAALRARFTRMHYVLGGEPADILGS
ncbi:MAG TPA: aminotransferase class I/II-fold pyridoxal phosphate-dependent enzyme [Sedimenticola thiotaurini]|uniref:Aminotransferase class I/II-fold pyridoxal phosphate-dependent enzyme n=1 Tax=Sedimenticola thiotaurini TaxID=1543721 RepID=A0A831W7B3_9GAMM|nr:aminotransferase class I/II-fold pyridoxal phosphate-dependent enzyme [Sedimenticola thiotaurini]